MPRRCRISYSRQGRAHLTRLMVTCSELSAGNAAINIHVWLACLANGMVIHVRRPCSNRLPTRKLRTNAGRPVKDHIHSWNVKTVAHEFQVPVSIALLACSPIGHISTSRRKVGLTAQGLFVSSPLFGRT